MRSIPGLRACLAAIATAVATAAIIVAPALADAGPADSASASLTPPRQFVSHHRVTIGGEKIAFTVTAGETWLYDDAGNPVGSLFTYAYVKDVPPGTRRPVMFVTGGGPGSASHFLQIGLLGPWALARGRLALTGRVEPAVTPPFDVTDNPDSVLDVTDLVFIDPVGTGYSRAIGKGRMEDFWGVDEDLDSIAQFIQLWVTHNGRWNSPKFFLGESYGGTRAALLPAMLGGGPGVPGYLRGLTLNGVVVLVNGLGYAIGSEGIGPIWLAATDLPNFAATAWYHQKIDRRGRSLETFYEEATQFALSGYADALRKEADGKLEAGERADVVRRITELTGLPATAFATKLALPREDFARLLLADRDLDVSVYDSRHTYPHGRGGGDPVADDASLARTMPVLTGAFLDVEHSKLGVSMDRPFAAIRWRDLLAKWNFKRRAWTDYRPGDRNNAEELAAAMNRNDRMVALVATGYYDLLSSPAQARFVTRRAGMPADRTILKAYEGGHEPYVDDTRAILAQDIRQLVRRASVP